MDWFCMNDIFFSCFELSHSCISYRQSIYPDFFILEWGHFTTFFFLLLFIINSCNTMMHGTFKRATSLSTSSPVPILTNSGHPEADWRYLCVLIQFTFRLRKVNSWKIPPDQKSDGLQIIISPEPFDLWAGIAVDDITFFVLEVPGNDNKDIPFTDPDFLFYLTLDPPHPCDTIKTADTDMVCTHHQFSVPEHFPVSFLGQFNPYDLITRRWSRFSLCQYNLSCVTPFWCRFISAQFLA